MQSVLPFGQSAALGSLRDALRGAFGPMRDQERLSATDQFVRSFLASRTYDRVSWNAFVRLAERYRDWQALADAPAEEIEVLLEGVTHSEKKAPELKAALRQIRARAGAIDLDFLAGLPVETALLWLEQIHGVGRKIAAATLNFSALRARAFVADTHVMRVLARFGFVRPNAQTADVYDAVMAAGEGFGAGDLYELHWLLKRLGQKTCTHFRAACDSCPLAHLCMQRVECAAEAGFAA